MTKTKTVRLTCRSPRPFAVRAIRNANPRNFRVRRAGSSVLTRIFSL